MPNLNPATMTTESRIAVARPAPRALSHSFAARLRIPILGALPVQRRFAARGIPGHPGMQPSGAVAQQSSTKKPTELYPKVDGAVKSRFLIRVGWIIIVHVYFTRPTDWGIV